MKKTHRARIVVAPVIVTVVIGAAAYLLCGSNATPALFIGHQYASLIPAPGESSTFSALIATKDDDELTLVSVRLLPLSGYRLPVLRHVMLLRVTSLHPTEFLADYGWPIREPNGSPFHLVTLRGSTVQTGRPRGGGPGYSEIVYNIAGGPNKTNVADAGVAVTFSVNGSTHSANIYEGAVACFQNRIHGKPKFTYCTTARMDVVEKVIIKGG